MSNNKLPASDKLKVAIRKYVGYSETEVYEAIQDYTNEVVKYTLEQAADQGKVLMIPNCDDHTPYWGACVSCGRIDNPDVPMEQIDKESILSLESQIIKDLKL